MNHKAGKTRVSLVQSYGDMEGEPKGERRTDRKRVRREGWGEGEENERQRRGDSREG